MGDSEGIVVSLATGEPVPASVPLLERLAAQLEDRSWFSSLGLPPTESEQADLRTYLVGLGLKEIAPVWLGDLAAAAEIVKRPDWHRHWGAAERTAVEALTHKCNAAIGERRATGLLNQVMKAASEAVIGPAAVAASRAGIADQALNRAMAGAAIQSAYEMALVIGADVDSKTHPLAAKARLFNAGHWPLAAVGDSFYVI
jgi:hypothetical protein